MVFFLFRPLNQNRKKGKVIEKIYTAGVNYILIHSYGYGIENIANIIFVEYCQSKDDKQIYLRICGKFYLKKMIFLNSFFYFNTCIPPNTRTCGEGFNNVFTKYLEKTPMYRGYSR